MRDPFAGIGILIRLQSQNASVRERCLRSIWEEYYPRLMVFVRGFGNVMEADDLVQEIMEKIFRGIDSYRPPYSFSTWVYSVARNHCLDRVRRERKAPRRVSLSDLPDSRQPSHHMTPEHEFLRRDAERRVEAFMESADQDTRRLAFLRFHQRLRCGQISEVMGIPVGTVKSRLHRLKESVSSCVEG